MDVRLGLIARADDRGLGTLTWEFHKHMQPDKTLVVLTGSPEFPEYPLRYQHGDVSFATLNPDLSLPKQVVQSFLEDLDVVYTAETFYDWRILDWADEMGVKTIVHGMPELTVHARKKNMRHPDEWWWPTDWLYDRLPPGPILPIPSVPHYHPDYDPYEPGPLRVVHPGGKMALQDRDGTHLVIEAMNDVTEDVELTIYSQDRSMEFDDPRIRFKTGEPDRWDIYRGHHLMVLPRRYGGLSLKVHEALDCGLPVIMPRVEPNGRWPGPRVPASPGRRILVPFGPLATFDADPVEIAHEIDVLAADRSLLEVEHRQAVDWSRQNDWSRWRSLYEKSIEALVA